MRARGRCDSARGAARAGGESVDLAVMLGDDAREWLRARHGRAYDPAVVDAFEGVGADVLSELDGADEWETALASEPRPVATVEEAALDAS